MGKTNVNAHARSFVDDKGRINYSRIRSIFKSALIDAGVPYKDFKPTHIWRHTRARMDLLGCLDALHPALLRKAFNRDLCIIV